MRSFVVSKVIAVNDEGLMLALRRGPNDYRRPGQWDFPGGHVDEGEDMMAAACREMLEETNLAISSPKLVFAMSEMTPDHGVGTWLVFVAHIKGDPAVTLSPEHDMHLWMSPQEFLKQAKYDRQIRMVQFVQQNDLLDPA